MSVQAPETAHAKRKHESCISLSEIGIRCYCPLAYLLLSSYSLAVSDPITSLGASRSNFNAAVPSFSLSIGSLRAISLIVMAS